MPEFVIKEYIPLLDSSNVRYGMERFVLRPKYST